MSFSAIISEELLASGLAVAVAVAVVVVVARFVSFPGSDPATGTKAKVEEADDIMEVIYFRQTGLII